MLLASARRSFPEFYAAATEHEAECFDALVLIRADYLVGVNASRANRLHVSFKELEQETTLNEHIFRRLCEAVRASQAFARLPAAVRARIDREIFAL